MKTNTLVELNACLNNLTGCWAYNTERLQAFKHTGRMLHKLGLLLHEMQLSKVWKILIHVSEQCRVNVRLFDNKDEHCV